MMDKKNSYRRRVLRVLQPNKAQFYLMAAIIIVVVLIGVATVTNFAISRESSEQIKIYQLSKELQLEGEQIVNFGIFNDDVALEQALTSFTEQYGTYIGDQNNNVYFIYGDKKQLHVVGYVISTTGDISLEFQGTPIEFDISGGEIVRTEDFDFSLEEDLDRLFDCSSDNDCESYVNENNELIKTDIIVDVGGTKYPFDIKEGQNFFFVIKDNNEADGEAG